MMKSSAVKALKVLRGVTLGSVFALYMVAVTFMLIGDISGGTVFQLTWKQLTIVFGVLWALFHAADWKIRKLPPQEQGAQIPFIVYFVIPTVWLTLLAWGL